MGLNSLQYIKPMSIQNIPGELRNLPQWVCAGSDKIPINPRTGKPADPSNPASGSTFADAVGAGLQHIGFILGKDDPFTVIDLDDPFERIMKGVKSPILPNEYDYAQALERAERHQKIFEAFPTYAETSQSGRGVHLVMRGKIPCGVRRDKVEIYSQDRYIIFTGNVLRNAPVADCQKLLDGIFSEMGKMITDKGDLIEEQEILTDSQIWRMATSASNADKFLALCEGQWESLGCYPSQSEADFAMISILAFYTRSNQQVRRMFRDTSLGKRAKSQRNDVYIDRSLRRIRAREAKLVDISSLATIAPAADPAKPPEPSPAPDAKPEPPADSFSFPPGLVGDVAKYILSSSIRPVPEVALAAAIALCAGVCARSYNISGTGLNQYIMLLAKTGRGKEGAATGIDNLIAAVRQNIPMADSFIGPAAFASGQALVKILDKQPCFVSVLGEFGLTLQQICDPKAPGPLVMLKKVLLDIYAKSGFSKMLRSSVYSDSEKNTRIIQAPNVTILGESTPETFFSGLDVSHIAEGLISRFTVIEYKGTRPEPNPNAFHAPDCELVKAFGELVTVAVNTSQNHTCAPVSMSPQAEKIFDKLNRDADGRINHSTIDTEAELWNRAHLKAMKLSALVAVGLNVHAPHISAEVAQWGVSLVRKEIGDIFEHFKSGDMGSGEGKQECEVRRLFAHFQTLTQKQRSDHRCPDALMKSQIVPHNFLTIYTRRLACFRNDRRGPTKALQDLLADMVKREVFEMVPLQQLTAEFGTRTPIYYPGPAW
jgi:post-segregation antitoxin (ccd killing protein)